MQTLAAEHAQAKPTAASLHEEARGLEDLHRAWTQHVAAWRLAHDAAVADAVRLLDRMDATIASLEAP